MFITLSINSKVQLKTAKLKCVIMCGCITYGMSNGEVCAGLQ